MPTYLIVGIPAISICLLIGIVIFERHAKRVGTRKRSEQLKLWVSSHGSTHPRASDGLPITDPRQPPRSPLKSEPSRM
jgi:hypothetical protein